GRVATTRRTVTRAGISMRVSSSSSCARARAAYSSRGRTRTLAVAVDIRSPGNALAPSERTSISAWSRSIPSSASAWATASSTVSALASATFSALDGAAAPALVSLNLSLPDCRSPPVRSSSPALAPRPAPGATGADGLTPRRATGTRAAAITARRAARLRFDLGAATGALIGQRRRGKRPRVLRGPPRAREPWRHAQAAPADHEILLNDHADALGHPVERDALREGDAEDEDDRRHDVGHLPAHLLRLLLLIAHHRRAARHHHLRLHEGCQRREQRQDEHRGM